MNLLNTTVILKIQEFFLMCVGKKAECRVEFNASGRILYKRVWDGASLDRKRVVRLLLK